MYASKILSLQLLPPNFEVVVYKKNNVDDDDDDDVTAHGTLTIVRPAVDGTFEWM